MFNDTDMIAIYHEALAESGVEYVSTAKSATIPAQKGKTHEMEVYHMNKQQKAYAVARARVDALIESMNENEAQFIREQGITNPDGSTPKRLYMIDDEDAFDKACECFQQSPLCLDGECNAAEKELKQAEDALIEYALSIAPPSIADTLRKSCKQYKIRQRLIDLAFRLDTRTVPSD